MTTGFQMALALGALVGLAIGLAAGWLLWKRGRR